MKTIKEEKTIEVKHTWEEKSGLLAFLSSVNKEVAKFNDAFEFGIINATGGLKSIDGNTGLPLKAGFVLERYNPLLPEARYCLYSVLSGQALSGHIGICRDGNVTTLRTLKPIRDFNKGKAGLYEWLRQLVRESFEKTML